MSWRVLEGDCVDVLHGIEDETVQTCVTSPPYWGLRDYGTAEWEGGDNDCAHRVGGQVEDNKAGGAIVAGVRPGVDASSCLDCGAKRIDAQLGLEPTPEQYVENMVAVFREVRRVLRADGTLWLNLGDSYTSGGRDWRAPDSKGDASGRARAMDTRADTPPGLKPKDLVGIPWRVAFALQADGWYLRSDIIWAKANPMPESVTDRPTKAHEYLFLLSKSPRYFYDADAVREAKAGSAGQPDRDNSGGFPFDFAGRNKRSVWTVATQPFPGAHFATFPPKLIEPCILAGSRPRGAIIEPELIATPLGERVGDDPSRITGRAGMNRPRGDDEGTRPITRHEQRRYAEQLKASPRRPQMESEAGEAFAHYIRTDASGARPVPPDLLDAWIERGWIERVDPPQPEPADPTTATVLDPFNGAGTTGLVATQQGRDYIGIELNPEYAEMARDRIRRWELDPSGHLKGDPEPIEGQLSIEDVP